MGCGDRDLLIVTEFGGQQFLKLQVSLFEQVVRRVDFVRRLRTAPVEVPLNIEQGIFDIVLRRDQVIRCETVLSERPAEVQHSAPQGTFQRALCEQLICALFFVGFLIIGLQLVIPCSWRCSSCRKVRNIRTDSILRGWWCRGGIHSS